MRNLRKVQAGRGVNAPGKPEIPESVFEELLVNALVHRDYLVNAPRAIGRLKASGHLKRIGSKKTGHWEIIDNGNPKTEP